MSKRLLSEHTSLWVKFTSWSSRDVKKVSSGFTVLCISKTRVCECTFTNEAKFCLIPTSKYQREGVHSNLEKFLKKVLQRLTAEQGSPYAELSRWSLSKYQHCAFCFMYFYWEMFPLECGCIPVPHMPYMAIQFGSLTLLGNLFITWLPFLLFWPKKPLVSFLTTLRWQWEALREADFFR